MANANGLPDTFAICIRNDGYPVSLEVWKVYRVIPDPRADEHSFVRVIDESGEDYLYPKGYFVGIQLPKAAREALLAVPASS
ncbi:MAG: hypothetical protein ACP5SH_12995 [Syntrophobacteraceae bacterium]